MGIGGGGYEVDINGRFDPYGGYPASDSGFIFRIAGGSDFMVWDRLGVFAEVGYDTAAISGVDGPARIVFGGTYKF